MTTNSIYRSKAQALFKYLPGCVVEAKQGIAVSKVSRWIGTEFTPKGEERLLDEIEEIIKRGGYRTVDSKLSGKLSASHFGFYRPKHIEIELFPLTFFISSGEKNAYTYDEFANIDVAQRKLAGRRGWVQSDLVYVSPNSSEIKPFHIVPCPTHKYPNSNMLLIKKTASQRGWVWHCKKCGWESNVHGYVGTERVEKAEPARAAVVFQPQLLQAVNVRDYSGYGCENEAANKAVIAKYLGYFGERSFESLFSELSNLRHSEAVAPENLDAVRQNLSQKFTKEQIDSIFAMMNLSTKQTGISELIEKAKSVVTPDSLDLVAFKLYEYLAAIEAERRNGTLETLDNLISKNAGKETGNQYEYFKSKLMEIGVKNSYALQKVPLIQIAYGYTRGKLDTTECRLNSFQMEEGEERTPLYANDIETEALVFEFNKDKVAKWLVSNNLLKEWNMPDETQKKTWFLQNIEPFQTARFPDASGKTPLSYYVLTLLHTISHAMIKKLPSQAGVPTTTVGEIILPNIPAIMLFSNSGDGFNMGELNELYRNRIYPWIDELKNASEKGECVYDPLCFETDAACHYCLFLHEASCSNFNKNLRRDYLFSGGSSEIKHGFWDTQ